MEGCTSHNDRHYAMSARLVRKAAARQSRRVHPAGSPARLHRSTPIRGAGCSRRASARTGLSDSTAGLRLFHRRVLFVFMPASPRDLLFAHGAPGVAVNFVGERGPWATRRVSGKLGAREVSGVTELSFSYLFSNRWKLSPPIFPIIGKIGGDNFQRLEFQRKGVAENRTGFSARPKKRRGGV